MEDNLFSCSCPKCHNSLFEAAICNPLYFFKAQCPYCASLVHWARLPMFLIIVGMSSLFLGIYLLATIAELPANISMLPAISIGAGAVMLVLGLMFCRIVGQKTKKTPAVEEIQNQASAF